MIIPRNGKSKQAQCINLPNSTNSLAMCLQDPTGDSNHE